MLFLLCKFAWWNWGQQIGRKWSSQFTERARVANTRGTGHVNLFVYLFTYSLSIYWVHNVWPSVLGSRDPMLVWTGSCPKGRLRLVILTHRTRTENRREPECGNCGTGTTDEMMLLTLVSGGWCDLFKSHNQSVIDQGLQTKPSSSCSEAFLHSGCCSMQSRGETVAWSSGDTVGLGALPSLLATWHWSWIMQLQRLNLPSIRCG